MLDLKASTTYMATLEEGIRKGKLEGKLEGSLAEGRRVLLRLGEKRFGGVSSDVVLLVDEIADLERIESLIERALEVDNWAELLS